MNSPADIARRVRADLRAAVGNGTLAIPDYVTVAIRADQRGLAPSVNVTFRPSSTADDDADCLASCVDAWKYTAQQDGTHVLSDDVKAAGTAIIKMIKRRSDGSCYGQINCDGTIIAILIPQRDG